MFLLCEPLTIKQPARKNIYYINVFTYKIFIRSTLYIRYKNFILIIFLLTKTNFFMVERSKILNVMISIYALHILQRLFTLLFHVKKICKTAKN
jgi:hypothetical protein